MHSTFKALLLVAGATIAGQAAAQTGVTGYGSATAVVKRNCPTDPTVACNGTGAGQGVAQRGNVGGQGQEVNYAFAATGTGIGSTAVSRVAFGDLGLPTIRSSVAAVGSVRLSDTIVTYQTYTYNGADDLEDLRLDADFHIVNSSGNANFNLPGGAIATAGFAIWNKDDFFTYAGAYFTGTGDFSTPASLTNQAYLFGGQSCEYFDAYADPTDLPRGPRASSAGQAVLTGGETTIHIAQENCHEQTLTLEPGEEFVVAAFTQLIANRNGFVDATGTFRLGLDPAMDAADVQAFRTGTTYASADAGGVPEPATWTMMIVGFGAVGAALRRRRGAAALA